MTSKGDSLKTNEFLRLRKLRLQQVREQSKDIAKKIRQRAKVEQLRHGTDVDKNKERDYLKQQERLVHRLEKLYSKSIQNVGAGHKNACEVNEKEIPEKVDLSKLRGKEAVAILKKKKQDKLDEQKKLLDRKLQAREVANVLSREKFAAVANTLTKSSSGKYTSDAANVKINNCDERVDTDNIETQKSQIDPTTKNDMGTQWEFEEIPNEWEPNIPTLSIPIDDSLKNSADDNADRPDLNQKNKRINLFALSDEMPSSLRGGSTSIPDERLGVKPSLTLVSEYLQTRGLRLREPNTTQTVKKTSDDLQSIKQTLLRTRASKTDGSVYPNICHVLDEEVIPMLSWRAERNCDFCSNKNEYIPRHYENDTSDNYNKYLNLKPGFQNQLLGGEKPKPQSKYHKCHQRLRTKVSGKTNRVDRSSNMDDINRAVSKKSSVTMYDHNTRDTKDLPHNAEKLVVREQTIDDDAYSQALKEASVVDNSDKSHHTIHQEARNRLAVTRQNVDKEYRDTLAFLHSLPKEKPAKSIKTAYMDGNREQELRDRRQHKMQEEFKKIEKQCSKQHCKHTRNKIAAREQNRNKSKSPVTIDTDNNIVNSDFQYSWLPVPESDGSMAIHTISNNVKDKTGNTVKFSSVDTYHEYRSRHKHTPPTRDVNETNKRVVEAVIIQNNSNGSIEPSSETDTSSVENLQVRQDSPSRNVNKDESLADAERIIIYKVMESKKAKKHKIKKTLQKENNSDKKVAENNIEIGHSSNENTNNDAVDNIKTNTVSFSQLKEGIYKSVSSKGDNIASLYFSGERNNRSTNQSVTNISNENLNGTTTSTRVEHGSKDLNRKSKPCDNCKNTDSNKYDRRPSAATSTSSFNTAVNDKPNNVMLDGGCIKFVDDGSKDNGKFYVGASGFLKDDAYEVVIQLRKKETDKIRKSVSQDKSNIETNFTLEKNIQVNDVEQSSVPVINEVNSSKIRDETEMNKGAPKDTVLVLTNNIEPQEKVPEKKSDAAKAVNTVDSNVNHSTIQPAEINEKGISTAFQDDFAIPDNVPKSDPISRPVNSICTQTSQNSSIPRPVFMHLSSSTSTTYMSPPEIILPRYLRHGSTESCDDTYEPISSNFNSQNRYTNCASSRCGKCKKREKEGNINTPPNTTRSDQTTDNFINEEQYAKCSKTENRHKNIKYVKCRHRSESKICSKNKFKRSPGENKRFHSGSNYSGLSIKKNRITNKIDKVNLNPVIETYVKKLLALNKEGLKAIEVVNQECSVVNTPGSSVIDVPANINTYKTMACNKISLEQIKNSLEEQILKNVRNRKVISKGSVQSTGSQTEKNIKCLYKSSRKRPVHKVKSFNISKQLIKTNKDSRRQSAQSTVITTSPRSIDSKTEKVIRTCSYLEKNRPQSPTHRQMSPKQGTVNNSLNSETSGDSKKIFRNRDEIKTSKIVTKTDPGNKCYRSKVEMRRKPGSYPFPTHKVTNADTSESEASNSARKHRNLSTPPISISTQTNQIDSEVEFMKLAENKLQNMEKIADLTEKCTKRLSNLAKVLEEVRKNKSLVYSQISTSECASDSDQRSDKNIQTSNAKLKPFNSAVEIQALTEALSSLPTSPHNLKNDNENSESVYVPILMDLPKPDTFKTPSSPLFPTETNKADVHIVMEQQFVKNRGKPPPALTRVNFKHVPDGYVIPHELSTVVEVDSPMSIKFKSHTTQMGNKSDTDSKYVDEVNKNNADDALIDRNSPNKPVDANTKHKIRRRIYETQSTDTSDDSKVKMMDLKYFNEIMLKPFISLKDYAKQYNLDEFDGQSSVNGISKDENVNEELSSLHSDASLPDVMAELLKRNLISEPFKFETTSNVNSTTVSTESTLSLLALSKARKDKKKSTMLIKNKENIVETSASLSMSSNPDLEHAFQRLGMGWASSTLKKTKERLALSSSSNTSSSSIPHFKIKSFNYHDPPELSSLVNVSNKEELFKSQMGKSDIPKNALQQTSLTNSMTVKEFLANELANKITFSNKTNRNSTDDEFISLCETKMPDEMKHLSQKPEVNEKSADSLPSGNIRARTSTPVQFFKSMTYQSTSSSNTSNGLFSNADDLSSVKGTSNSNKNHSTSEKDDLTIPNYSLKMRKETTECNKSD